jgi:predicted ATPase with chaperone activity
MHHHLRLGMRRIRQTYEPRSVQIFERLLEGDSVRHVAKSFGTSEQAVHKVKQRIRNMLKRVIAARSVQQRRDQCCNALLEGKQLQLACEATPASWDLLEKAMDTFAMSARAHQRIWRVARTIADLAQVHTIEARHVGEAISLRYLDRGSGH